MDLWVHDSQWKTDGGFLVSSSKSLDASFWFGSHFYSVIIVERERIFDAAYFISSILWRNQDRTRIG
jgi:hypothetical protein